MGSPRPLPPTFNPSPCYCALIVPYKGEKYWWRGCVVESCFSQGTLWRHGVWNLTGKNIWSDDLFYVKLFYVKLCVNCVSSKFNVSLWRTWKLFVVSCHLVMLPVLLDRIHILNTCNIHRIISSLVTWATRRSPLCLQTCLFLGQQPDMIRYVFGAYPSLVRYSMYVHP